MYWTKKMGIAETAIMSLPKENAKKYDIDPMCMFYFPIEIVPNHQ